MRAGGGQPDDRITGIDPCAVDDRTLLNHAHAEPGEVVIVTRVDARHFGGLTTDQRRSRLDAAFGDTSDYRLRDVDSQLPCRVVVQKEEGLRSLDDNIVHAHGDQVNSNGVVATGVDREPKFCADAVRARNEHGLLVACGDFHQGAEAADAREDFGALRAPNDWLDALDELIARIDVDTGVAVGNSSVNWRIFSHLNILPAHRMSAWPRTSCYSRGWRGSLC